MVLVDEVDYFAVCVHMVMLAGITLQTILIVQGIEHILCRLGLLIDVLNLLFDFAYFARLSKTFDKALIANKKVNNSEQVQGDGVLVDEKLAKFLFSGQWFFHNCFCLEFIICATFCIASAKVLQIFGKCKYQFKFFAKKNETAF